MSVDPKHSELTSSKPEIARVLGLLQARKAPVTAQLNDGLLLFQSTLQHVDPGLSYVLFAPSRDSTTNALLCARPRCTFFSALSSWSIEFVAAEPAAATHDGAPAIRFAFPEVLVSLQRREHERASVTPGSLHCVADEGGFMAFDSL